jgi:ABC-2 type transport system permease protein
MSMFKPYWAALVLDLQTVLRFRSNILFFLTAVLIPPLAVFFLWRTVLGTEEAIGAYDLRSMVTYYLIVQFMVANTPHTATYEIRENIYNGRLAAWLARPCSYFTLYLARVIGSWIPFWLFGAAGTSVVALVLRDYVQLPPHPVLLVLALLLWLGGVLLGFTWGYLINLTAFWTERAVGVVTVADVVVFFLAGGILPLDLLPVQWLWQALPFRFFGWVPAQVYLGRLDLAAIGAEWIKLMIWVLVLLCLSRLLWRRGLRRFQGPGG